MLQDIGSVKRFGGFSFVLVLHPVQEPWANMQLRWHVVHRIGLVFGESKRKVVFLIAKFL